MNQEERSRGFLPAMAGSSCTTTSSNRHDETFITYPAADDIITEAEARVLGVAALQRPHLLIVSQAHNGKQSIINWIARRHRPFRVASLLAPVVSMACAELPVRVTEATLCRAVATALGVVACARLEDLISRCREASTRIIVIRDLHDLAMPDWPLHLRLLERLDELTSDAGISLVFTATLRVNEL
ncbi:MAG TPA: TniB family NTP-binding protein, partial [Blastocatellia bacterium]|nr:TniB family NTP-binding protein [Blastocatellia bacterium]